MGDRAPAGKPGIDVVFLDIGGVIYDDRVYRRAVLRGLRDLGAAVTEEEYEAAYEELRRAQGASFRDALADRVLSSEGDRAAGARAVAPPTHLPAPTRLASEELSGGHESPDIARSHKALKAASELSRQRRKGS